jgi:hypothetical protein
MIVSDNKTLHESLTRKIVSGEIDVKQGTGKGKHVKQMLQNSYGTQKTDAESLYPSTRWAAPLNNQKGSVIISALMVLVIMTVIGLISADTVVTENFILRNQGIYKQNVNMLEAAIMEGLQQFMQIPYDDDDLVNVNNSTNDWINDINSTATDWYETEPSDRAAPMLETATALDITTPHALAVRGEDGGGNLLVSFVGWEIVSPPGGGSASLKTGASQPPVIKKGRILGEYISAGNGYGMLRMEIGVMRKVSTL